MAIPGSSDPSRLDRKILFAMMIENRIEQQQFNIKFSIIFKGKEGLNNTEKSLISIF
jgi:hypothetical protein